MKHRKFTLLLCLVFFSLAVSAQNLIVNPGAEDPTSNGWTIISQGNECFGSENWRIQGNQNGYPPARSGSWYFNAGCGSIDGEVYQDVDVSSFATEIDAGTQAFTFSGWLQTYDQTPSDLGQFIVRYLDAGNNVLATYDSGPQQSPNVWTEFTSSITAPAGTRTIRITMFAHAVDGGAIDAYFDDLSLTASTVVPVTLTSFSTVVRNGQVIAAWKTASESNSSHFDLQRSADGEQWQTVTSVSAAGNSSVAKSYSAIDENPMAGTSYYRLLQVDQDGKMAFSKVSMVSFTGAALNLKVYPNPATSYVLVEGDKGALTTLSVYNATGSNVTNNVRLSKNSDSQIRIDVSSLNRGTYFIRTAGSSVSFFKQ